MNPINTTPVNKSLGTVADWVWVLACYNDLNRDSLNMLFEHAAKQGVKVEVK